MVEEILSPTEWTSVLKLAAMWRMDRLRGIAVERMKVLTVNDPGEWMEVLDWSDMHQFSDCRELAIERLSRPQALSNIKGVARVQLARKYRVERWLKEGLQDLAQRGDFFSDEEEELLGWKTVIKLYRVRIGHLKSRLSGTQVHSVRKSVRISIEAEFEAELKETRPECGLRVASSAA
jgi:hypothetical protein